MFQENAALFSYEDLVDRNQGTISPSDQALIRRSKIGIFGLGGMSLVGLLAARTGFQKFTLVDKDIYTVTNLNRQMGAFFSNLNKPKATAMKDLILDINPEAEVDDLLINIQDIEQAKRVMGDVDYLFIGIDDAVTRVILARAAEETGKTILIFCPMGFKFFSTICKPGGIGYEKLTYQPSLNKDIYDKTLQEEVELHQKIFFVCARSHDLRYCKEYLKGNEPVKALGITVNMLGSWIVGELVKLITGKGTPHVAPEVYTFNVLTGKSWNFMEVGTLAYILKKIIRKKGLEKGLEFVDELYCGEGKVDIGKMFLALGGYS
ncbi:MAG: hypothetical protein C4570_07930 [Ammonifex sp.]|jgi:molybdopterin/thiamine biosynthesis adenylyltransferase|nr:MAG: hypothetical protein C4570_07930 [Ammonifex sp.]